MECEYCNQILKTAGALKKHQNTAKYCLIKQNKSAPEEHSCIFCGTSFTLKFTFQKFNFSNIFCEQHAPTLNNLSLKNAIAFFKAWHLNCGPLKFISANIFKFMPKDTIF